MRKSNYIGIAVLVALGIGISFIVKPGERELGLMNMQDKKFKQALEIYEQRYHDGDHSIAVTIPLSKLYLQYGSINKSITIMEQFIRENPDNISAKKHLAKLYQYAQRPEEYTQILEDINHAEPTPETLQSLADIYNFKGQYQKQITVLSDLLKQHKATPADIMMLVYLYVNHNEFDNAVYAINSLTLETIKALPTDTAEFLCGVLIDANKRNDALIFARNYINITTPPGKVNYYSVILFASLFQTKGDIGSALALLAPLKSNMKTNPQLLAEYANVQVADGKTNESFQILLELFRQKKLDSLVVDNFIELVLIREEYELLPDIVTSLDLKILPERRLIDLVLATNESKEQNITDLIIQNLGEEYLKQNPSLSIALSVANSVSKQETPPISLQEIKLLPLDSQIVLARMYLNADLRNEALAIVKGFPTKTFDMEIDPLELALLYIELKIPDLGISFFSKLDTDYVANNTKEFEEARILLEAGRGNEQMVMAWLNKHSSYDPRFMEILNFTAIINKKPEIALFTAQHLYTKYPSQKNQIHFAEALILNNHYLDALEYLRIILDKNSDVTYPYINALLGGSKQEPSLQKELGAYLQSESFKHLDTKKKRDIAFLLLDYNQKPLAMPLFFEFARNANAASPDVQQILYLWGPIPPEYAQNWLIRRAKTASGKEQSLWLKHMNDAGMNDTVISLAETTNQNHNDAYIKSLIYKKQFSKLDKILRPEFNKTNNISYIKKLTKYAVQANLLDLAESGYRTIYQKSPKDYNALKELAQITYAQGKYTEARKYLKTYLSYNPKDYLLQYYYAEILNRSKNYDNAMLHYKKAVELIVATQPKDTRMNLTYALILYRLGNTKESFEQFKALLKKEPQNTEIRESFANILIEGGRYREAEEVLSDKNST